MRSVKSVLGIQKNCKYFFDCSEMRLNSLDGCPSKIGNGFFDCSHNELESFKDIHLYIKEINGVFICNNNPIQSHVLGLFLIKGITEIIHESQWASIVNKHIQKGRKGMLACQKELIKAGLKEYAQL